MPSGGLGARRASRRRYDSLLAAPRFVGNNPRARGPLGGSCGRTCYSVRPGAAHAYGSSAPYRAPLEPLIAALRRAAVPHVVGSC